MRASTPADPGRCRHCNMVVLFSVWLRKGDERLSDVIGSESRRASGNRDKKRASKPNASGSGSGARSKSSTDVGRALRSVYDNTLGERVPDDFLDLLGKLS